MNAMLRPLLLLSLLLLLAPTLTRAAAPVTFSAGAASADITPDPKMLNWVPLKPYGALNDPIFARVIVLSDGTAKIALIAWDLLDAREYAVARIRTAITKATGIPGTHVIINASHNHSGPKSEMGSEPNTQREAKTSRPAQLDPLYRVWADRLVQTCVDLVAKADAARQPATLAIGRATIGEWMFNRRPIKPDSTVLSMLSPADPYVLGQGLRFGTVDPTMTVLSLRTADGKGIATLFHAPTTRSRSTANSPGFRPTGRGRSCSVCVPRRSANPFSCRAAPATSCRPGADSRPSRSWPMESRSAFSPRRKSRCAWNLVHCAPPARSSARRPPWPPAAA